VLGVDPDPSLPESLKLTLFSRRFAKLLEDTQKGVGPETVKLLRQGLRDDLDRYAGLVRGGQGLRAETKFLKKVGTNSQELIVPLSFRINARLLLVGERACVDCLPEVIATVDTMGEDVNWAAAAYACDKIMSAMVAGKSPAPPNLAQYQEWRTAQKKTAFFDYRRIDLPSYKSPRRPNERATAMGAAPDFSAGTVSAESPPDYAVYRTPRQGADHYLDRSGNTQVARQIVAFARKLIASK
jgi:hypothetical protein